MYVKRYQGKPGGEVRVFLINRKTRAVVRERHLNPRLDLSNHSPTGFNWGYGGSGPAQLALAILADALGSGRDDDALELHQLFKWQVVARFPMSEGWTITSDDVRRFEADARRGQFSRSTAL